MILQARDVEFGSQDAPKKPILERLGGGLEASWKRLGASCMRLGGVLGRLGCVLGRLGGRSGPLGARLEQNPCKS